MRKILWLAAGLTASVLVALAWEWFHARKGRRERRRSYSEAR